jgi:hypothetical protein
MTRASLSADNTLFITQTSGTDIHQYTIDGKHHIPHSRRASQRRDNINRMCLAQGFSVGLSLGAVYFNIPTLTSDIDFRH